MQFCILSAQHVTENTAHTVKMIISQNTQKMQKA